MKVLLTSSKPDHRAYAASAFLQEIGVDAHASHLESADFEPDGLTITTLASFGILGHNSESSQLTQADKDSFIVAMDEVTRNKIQEDFSKLVPLYNEVHNNTSSSLELENTINTIHHLKDSSKQVKERLHHFN